MTTLYFATSAPHARLTADDLVAAAELESRGVRVLPLVWSEPGSARRAAGDVVVIRSCWDYHLHADAFAGWLEELEAHGARVVNDVRLLRWNLHKRYLLDLEARGHAIVPTTLAGRGRPVSLRDLAAAVAADRMVVKPAVSLSAHETWTFATADAPAHEARFARLLADGDMLVQPFVPEIADDGEWSLIFFGDTFSHAVNKRAAAGDFRVQSEHGGTASPAPPPITALAAATRLLRSLEPAACYTRVDGLMVRDEFLLMELECIDPVLFFAADPNAAARFADVLMAAADVRPGATMPDGSCSPG
jgi:glutathione synthase/RimK-type ligase-like ATP-grasp enzyme